MGIHSGIEQIMYLWYQSHFVALVDDTIAYRQGGGQGPC